MEPTKGRLIKVPSQLTRVESAHRSCASAKTATRPETIVMAPTGSRSREFTMAKCDACGNDYDKSFQVVARGKTYTFDSFECAIHALAPTCAHCGVRIIGTGWRRATGCSAAITAPSRRA